MSFFFHQILISLELTVFFSSIILKACLTDNLDVTFKTFLTYFIDSKEMTEMKKTILLLAICFSLFFNTNSYATNNYSTTSQFSDVSYNHWGYSYALDNYFEGSMIGVGKTKDGKIIFAPEKTLSIGEMTSALTRTFYPQEYQNYQAQNSNWLYPATSLTKDKKLALKKSFSEAATRYDVANMLYQLFDRAGKVTPNNNTNALRYLADYQEVLNSKHRDAVVFLINHRILNGIAPHNRFVGSQKLTRIQMAAILTRVMDFKENGYVLPTSILSENQSNPGSQNTNYTVQEPAGESFQKLQEEVLTYVNIERKKAGLKPLALHPQVNQAAAVRVKEITQKFEHVRLDGSKFSTVFKELGIPYRTVGENIGAGYPNAKRVVSGWMDSDGHRQNILNPDYQYMGLAHTESNDVYRNYWVQLFYTK